MSLIATFAQDETNQLVSFYQDFVRANNRCLDYSVVQLHVPVQAAVELVI
jgi:hypothetical protein